MVVRELQRAGGQVLAAQFAKNFKKLPLPGFGLA
jgi:hypothetical protein